MDLSRAITVATLPNAYFLSRQAQRVFIDDACAYESAVAAYERNRDASCLRESLTALGISHAQIEMHAARPGYRTVRAYA